MSTKALNETFEIKFKLCTVAQLKFALADLREVLAIWKDEDNAYTRKLWAEWDFCITKLQKMEKAR